MRRGGKQVHLGSFATAEEAALCVARSPEGQAAAKRAAAAPPLTSEEARQQARAEGLTLLKADNKAGYFGVYLTSLASPKPYQARVRRGGKMVSLGYFATAEEAALCVAQSPEGRAAAAKRAAAASSTGSEEEGKGMAPAHAARRLRQGGGRATPAACRQGGGRQSRPCRPTRSSSQEHEVVVKEEGSSVAGPSGNGGSDSRVHVYRVARCNKPVTRVTREPL